MPALTGSQWASVWLHDRRARTLSLAASSTPVRFPDHQHLATTDSRSPLVVALRQEEPSVAAALHTDEREGATLLVPLRGRRRALGVLVIGLRVPSDAAAALDVARQLGEGVATAIDNVQLLDDVLRSRRELENVLDALVDLVAVTSADGRIVHVNRRFADRLGVLPPALMDAPLTARVAEPLAAWIDAHVPVIPGAPARTTVSDERLGAILDVTLTALAPVSTPGAVVTNEYVPPASGHVFIARDVTDEHRRAAHQRELEQRLVRSEKLLALAQFVAGIAHELNNPLQGVLGHLELLRAHPKLPSWLRRDLGVVYRDADRAARIVRNLLLFAGSGRLQKRVVSLNAVIERVLRLRAAVHRRRGIDVRRVLDPGAPRVLGDAVLLQQAVLNVVLNAEQAMDGTGRLTLRTCVSRRGITVIVDDTGPGLDDEVQARLFEPFFTTRDVGHGIGLGLAIVFGIAQAHDATVEASNVARGGARFTITFPVATVARAHSARTARRPVR